MQVSTRMWVRRISVATSNLLWPSCCVICQRRGQIGLDLCSACESLLPPLIISCKPRAVANSVESLCAMCGSVVVVNGVNSHGHQGPDEPYSSASHPTHVVRCGNCVNRTSPYAGIVSPYRYDFPLDHLVHTLKYQHRRELARVFGVLLARAARCCVDGDGDKSRMPELLLPVPAHSSRLAQRDFNQAADMARWCAAELGLRALPGWARRIVDTPSLAGLSRSERQLCIRGAFSVDARVADRHVAIVDDVLTSGATTGELARELFDSGAASVQLWVLARTPSAGSSNSRRNRSGNDGSLELGQSLDQSAW